MAAARVGAHGEVGHQANRHAGVACRLLRRRHAEIRLPLHEGVKGDLWSVGLSKLGNGRIAGIAMLFGPIPPMPAA